MILIGPGQNQVTCNPEAIQILSYPTPSTGMKRLGALLKEKMGAFIKQGATTNGSHAVMEFISGRRCYRCTRYLLNVQALQGAKTVVILMERIGSPDVTMQELCTGLQLTQREREAVGLLVRGLTSKEIAQQMGISPNTVKSFLRLAMTKAGATTRTGLIGQVAGLVPRPRAMSVAAGQIRNADQIVFQGSVSRAG
jgi:DNA-binding CsgD family transcriptional regulator